MFAAPGLAQTVMRSLAGTLLSLISSTVTLTCSSQGLKSWGQLRKTYFFYDFIFLIFFLFSFEV